MQERREALNIENVREIFGICRGKWTHHLLVLIVKDTRITKLLYRCSPTGEKQIGYTKEKMEKETPMKTEEKRNGL